MFQICEIYCRGIINVFHNNGLYIEIVRIRLYSTYLAHYRFSYDILQLHSTVYLHFTSN